jgi:hypothetical protein
MTSSIPHTAGDIDPEWLTGALERRHPGVRVVAVEVVDRSDATNSHARLRVRYDPDAGAPEQLFCKMLPTDPGWRSLIAATGMGWREANFYARLAPALELRTPLVHAAEWTGSDGPFVLLLEDLTSTGCGIPDGTRGYPVDAAARALEDLAQLHARYEDPGVRAREAGWVPEPLHDPGYASGMLQRGLDQHRDRLSSAFARIAESYITRADAMHALWQQGPTTVIHGDPHLGNLFDERGRIGFLDWGIISLGTPMRDVSYFLCMAMDPALRRDHEETLLRHYLESRIELGAAAIDFDTAWQTHRLHAAYTVVASCQIVTFPDSADETRERFASSFLQRAESAIDDLESDALLTEALESGRIPV